MPKKLTESEILDHLANVANWQRHGDKIHKKFHFKNFAEAFGFMSSCAIRAEAMNHHPEWSNVYNVVSVDLTTHDANGLSDLDFRLAQEIDALAGK